MSSARRLALLLIITLAFFPLSESHWTSLLVQGATTRKSPAALSATNPSQSPGHDRMVLVTKNYQVTIIDDRPEGELESNHVIYRGVSLKSGNAIVLKGSTYYHHDRNGTPIHFLGWIFHNGNVTYQVLEEGELTVIEGESKVLVEERGMWQDEIPSARVGAAEEPQMSDLVNE
jgi:hypothetical protein